MLAYPRDRAAYGRLCRLLTTGNLRAPKGECWLDLADLLDLRRRACRSSSCRPPTPGPLGGAEGRVRRPAVARRLPYLWRRHARRAGARARRWRASSALPLLAVNDALMHVPERRPLADVARLHPRGRDAGGRRAADAGQRRAASQRRRRDGAAVRRGARRRSRRALRFLDGLSFSLDELAHVYPEELREGYATPQAALEAFAEDGRARALSRRRSRDRRRRRWRMNSR